MKQAAPTQSQNHTERSYRNLPKVSLSEPVLRKLEANLPEGMSLTKYVNQLLMSK